MQILVFILIFRRNSQKYRFKKMRRQCQDFFMAYTTFSGWWVGGWWLKKIRNTARFLRLRTYETAAWPATCCVRIGRFALRADGLVSRTGRSSTAISRTSGASCRRAAWRRDRELQPASTLTRGQRGRRPRRRPTSRIGSSTCECRTAWTSLTTVAD